VRPEAAAFLGKAREALAEADGMLERWPDEARREAYLAALHAAQALIVESTGKVVKSHRGVDREFGRLTRNEPRVDSELRAFLGRTYQLKVIADYETGPDSEVSLDAALAAIKTSKRFVAKMAELIEDAARSAPD
jgi:uncharacterized protein (UPF0332 family)